MNELGKIDRPRQLNLKDAETYELAAELAKLHGDTLSGAVKSALREKLSRDRRELTKQERFERIMAVARDYSRRAGPRTMTDEEAVGYDQNGLPT
ncbi:MAG: type II toxin-antitoxin system VapB family antitoxin [Devosia nanyangense]|uniref:Type II toxin-antitoxin system VapB family antitoxin n=1 Tax=Devosia nanyangense TaxID=1228055 RepID=A0A933NZL1_9HYPH|nr:type II toxin-antitoxin system VapB family antitoxin [Devosia nanyangense]